MKIAVLKETAENETRVAATPETVKKLKALGADITVETGAGQKARFDNAAYESAGAKIAPAAKAAVEGADIVLKVQRPGDDEMGILPKGAALVGILSPHGDKGRVEAYAKAGVNAYAMDLMPRITRAQSMDILSSQSNLAGYKAVIDATAAYGQALPMMMTAAGTVPAARVFVMGAGVAGLQAIATARRLGAIVTATDVRFAAKEQVESLGATFVTVDEEAMKDAETSGGYAKEMSDDFKKRQAEFVADHIAKQDIVITTALIPGRPAPELVSTQMVERMRPGSIIVDLAVEQGGNVGPSKPGKVVDHNGVTILGHANVPGRLAGDASALYARNLYNFLAAFHQKEDADDGAAGPSGAFVFDPEDDIIKGVALTRDGKVVHPTFSAVPVDTSASSEAPAPAASDSPSTGKTSE